MQKVNSYKCPMCKKNLATFNGWVSHMDKFHPNEIPKGYTYTRYFYYLQTKKTEGKCIVCGDPTKWNEATQKYERFCRNPKCKEKYREVFKNRMINKYGKVHLLNNPDMQRKMVSSRKISGEYLFKDKGYIGYVGSYEKEFLMMLDNMLQFSSNDILSPSPHTYYYEYKNENDKENEGNHFYIPDFYIPSLNLEIEVKSHTNQHHKIQAIDRVKEEAKDVVMNKLPNINYVKVVDKDYSLFFEKLLELKDEFTEISNQNTLNNSVLESFIDDNIENLDGDYTTESYIFNNKNLYINFNKFESDDSNTLLITGLSGSGKSTISTSLASKYKAEVIELDIFEHNNSFLDKNLIQAGEVFSIYFLEKRKDLRGNIVKNMSSKEFGLEFIKFFDFVLTYCNSHKNKKFIIEGVQIYSHIDLEKIKEKPIILINTSVKNSMLQRFKRNTDDGKINWKSELKNEFPQLIAWYIDNESKYKEFKKDLLKEEYKEINNTALESFIDDESSDNIEKVDGDCITESYIFNDKNLYINFDKFESGDSNTLLITGLSGSGKSTISISLASKYKAEVIDLDNFQYSMKWSDNTIIKAGEVFSIYFLEKRKDLRGKIVSTREEFNTEFKEFFKFVIEYCNSHKNKKFIIEGVQIFASINSDEIKGKPIILINKSMTDSMIQGFIRDINDKNKNWKTILKDNSPKLIGWYIKHEEEYQKFKKDILKEEYAEINNTALESFIDILNESNYPDTIVQESIFDIFNSDNLSKESIIISWKNKLLASKNLIGDVIAGKSDMVTLIKNKQYIQIQNINIKRLMINIKLKYGEVALAKLFILNYNKYDYKKFLKKRIPRGKMKIESLYIPVFFALEAIVLFDSLYEDYGMRVYKTIAKKIYSLTWVSEADNVDVNKLSLSNLKRIDRKELLPYQKEFIEIYPILKSKLNLKGYINAFEQGLGKTLTAVGLAECLNVKKIYIVCPNILKDNWALEIKEYYNKYNNDEDLWKKEVVICESTPKNVSDARFIITNNESISKMLPYITNEKDSMFILDESHNFRNLNGQRVIEILELVKKINSNNNLIMSGTPIKAIPNEIVPALLIIDPLFTMEAAEIYNKCFNISSTAAMEIVQKRFGMVIYRKTKDELTLPEKEIHQLSFKLDDSDKYTMSNCREEVISNFYKIYEEKMKSNINLQEEYIKFINKYSNASKEDTTKYIKWVQKNINTDAQTYLHELDMAFMKSFVSTYVKPNIRSNNDYKRVDRLEKEFIHMDRSAMGIAIGKVIPPRRTEMFIRLYNDNKDEIIDMIENNNKKVIIFSQFEKVAQFIANDLNEQEIKTLLITGNTKTDRTDMLQQFREDDVVQVLVATSQTMSTGVTLIDANKMFFFGPPWRSTDFDQASDRIHRIGQTSKVDIYLVSLDTGEKKNLATRMLDILDWSQDMFDSAINDSASIDETFEALESSFSNESCNIYDFKTNRKGLDNYLKSEVISKYLGREDGHGIDHINQVLLFSDILSSKIIDTDKDLCLTIAAYHDIGMLKEDRENHHINSAKYVEKERKILLKWFTNDEIDIISRAVLEHRASSNNRKSSIYSFIICDADKSGIMNITNELRRIWDYNFIKKEQDDTDLDIFNKFFNHINEKYGTYGYAKFHLDETKLILKDSIKKFHQTCDSKELTKELLIELYNNNKIQIVNDGTLFKNELSYIEESYSSIVDFLNNYYDRNNDITLESTIDDDKKYPIFIVLMHSGTVLANAIKKVTHDKFSHACISFNIKLNPLYSFGRKNLDMKKTGFVANSPKDEFFTKFKAYYSVYAIYVTKADINNMKSRLDFFIKNENKLRYDVKGLLLNYVHLPNENEKKYFCSRFVADILSSGKLVDKSPSLYKPNDFVYLKDIIKIDEGDDFYKYDWTTAFKNLEKINKE